MVAAATDREGYARAAAEYRQAVAAAPWLADAYFNLGVVLDKAGLHSEAVRNLQLYLAAPPGAAEAKQPQNRIYQTEFRMENLGSDPVVAHIARTGDMTIAVPGLDPYVRSVAAAAAMIPPCAGRRPMTGGLSRRGSWGTPHPSYLAGSRDDHER